MSVCQSTAVNGRSWVTITIGVEDGMEERWWMMRPATLMLLAGALLMARRDAVWPRLLGPLCSIVRPAKDTGDTEQGWLAEWLVGQGRGDLDPAEVQVAQISRDWAAKVLDGQDKSAGRAISAMEDIGLVTLVHKGVRGHSSLYVVNPLPEPLGTGSFPDSYPG